MYPSGVRSSHSVASATSGHSATHIQILPLNYVPFEPPLCWLRPHRGESGKVFTLLRSDTYKYQSSWKCSALYPSVASATSGYSATHIQILPLNYVPFEPPLCRLRRHRGESGIVFTLLRSVTYKYQSNWKCSALYPFGVRSSHSVASATSGYSATHIQILLLNYDPFRPPLCRLRLHRGERGMVMSGLSLHYVPLQTPHTP